MSLPEHSHLSGLTLDALLLGGLPDAEEKAARAHLEQCPGCARRLEETHTSTEHFRREVQPRTLEQLRRRLEQSAPAAPPWRRRAVLTALLVAGAAAAMLARVGGCGSP
ncbi:zf-HC2 domain-containing protein [Myxococcus sp. AM009]|uniref:anti-sigma factor family protein n=1 Tax=unclassified Myxococcus TaxID=2648731 RepID=UPI001595CD7F|nr:MULTISPECIES: zf-HC2 domain-containing protein [unclassified Myxococcus]NVJ03214.1 zf-HC2 domain-containing protein [Myxococcus sp. AM009]NVJ15695.1 zf-HC2 domain-containing protein [Myxococcus sp. AM010]